MARLARKATVGALVPDVGAVNDPNAAVTTLAAAITAAAAQGATTDTAEDAVAAAVAVLVADGASPTQAHVTDLNNAYTTFATEFASFLTLVNALSTTAVAATVSADVTLLVNTGNVTTKNKLTAAVNALLTALRDGTNAFPD